MELGIALSIPMEKASVTLTRNVVDVALRRCGVSPDARQDIGLALTEACTNAVRHSDTKREYQVDAALRHNRCVVEVTDHGAGFVMPDALPSVPLDAEGGRGLMLMYALTDLVEIHRHRGDGMTVHFEKNLDGALTG
ncbi:ATP-binding protein [Nonomuraea fastidiosa]|jgi:serine/threonine-protein kinase RsbW|uniref:ATP-binding protein n=1 Tax=Nonomuraea TaxID=83681 RepID=UPI003254F3E1